MDDDTNGGNVENNRFKRLRNNIEYVTNCDVNRTQVEKEQIHLIGNLLDLLEVGGPDSVLGMVDVIKLAQLTVSYFFWSLYEKSKIFLVNFICDVGLFNSMEREKERKDIKTENFRLI